MPGRLLPLALTLAAGAAQAAVSPCDSPTLDEQVMALMSRHDIPGLSVAVVDHGELCVSHFGVASRDTGLAVGDDTLFEIGSVTKPLTSVLAAWVHQQGGFDWGDRVASIEPRLAGSPVGETTLVELATYTAGGFPLQFPDGISQDNVLDYYRHWQPAFAPGAQRLYSNPSIGLFGELAARHHGQPFSELMQAQVLPTLGLEQTWLEVPEARLGDYAQGYGRDDTPVRLNPGVMDAQAYGIKTTAIDLGRFVQANLAAYHQDDPMSRALLATQHGYAAIGEMHQGLGWESYALPVSLDSLRAGTTAEMALEPQPATLLDTTGDPRPARWYHKTGSTNGFGAYAAFIPAQERGIAILANKGYPNGERVEAAWHILAALGE
ncbi:beta-lactamase [Bisbaumannia pacifica]|uniref:Beta-lactamase n=1 Tax=Bisbaumannia pacifica TaxID=77098 RepID=A0A510X5X3_9GAMM|nr:class C beta-lactamase [Halomonas pacifica]GEK46838.1 beta-lactamase [Halomonas pacifica]